MPDYFEYPDLILKKLSSDLEWSELVTRMQENFDAVYAAWGKPKGIQGDQGDIGPPGATRIGDKGDKGDRGSFIWYESGIVTDNGPVSNPDYIEQDTVIDSIGRFFEIVDDGAGGLKYLLGVDLGAYIASIVTVSLSGTWSTISASACTFVWQNIQVSSFSTGNVTMKKRVVGNICHFNFLIEGLEGNVTNVQDMISLELSVPIAQLPLPKVLHSGSASIKLGGGGIRTYGGTVNFEKNASIETVFRFASTPAIHASIIAELNMPGGTTSVVISGFYELN